MANLKLVAVSSDYYDQIQQYRQAYLDAGEDIHGGSGLENYEDPAEWQDLVARYRETTSVPTGWVPAETWLVVRESDNSVVGLVNLRLQLNEYLENYGGHVGYSIAIGEWGKGYGTVALALTIDAARERGMGRLLVTCDAVNHRSEQVIIHNGGVLENTVVAPDSRELRRYWITL